MICGPRETLQGKWLSNSTWIFVSFVLMSVAFCFIGQALPFIGAAGPKMLAVAFGKRAFAVPFIANIFVSGIAYLLRRISLFEQADLKPALIGFILSVVLIEFPYMMLNGHL